jgi:uridine kinase
MLPEKMEAVIALLNKYQAKPVVLAAIDGHSAAGKSTLARSLGDLLSNVTIVHMDDFYRPLDEEERAGLDAESGYFRYYDWERLETQVLRPLSNGDESSYQRYDWATNRLGEWVNVRAAGIVLIEGCYAARPELRRYYDVVLLVVTSAAQRLQRQNERADATPSWLARWHAAESYYMQHTQPHPYVDLVVSGE